MKQERDQVTKARFSWRRKVGKPLGLVLAASMATTTLAGCATMGHTASSAAHVVNALVGSPVGTNDTPYSVCLTHLASNPVNNKPNLTIGEVTDKTGQKVYDGLSDSTALTQGVSEMLISAFYKTKQVGLTERLDVRVPLAEQQLLERGAISGHIAPMSVLPANFVVLGALTELNYNITSGGARLYVAGIGGQHRTAVINVGLDLRLVDVRSLRTVYVTSLQKQIVGHEIEAGVYRFFEHNLIEFDAGTVKNEPLQLGVRSVVELATYQILTEGLGFPAAKDPHCQPDNPTHHMARQPESNS